MSTAAGVRKFTFDTVFDATGHVVREDMGTRMTFTRDEVEEAKQIARNEGENSAVAQSEAAAAAALAQVATNLDQLIGRLNADASQLKGEAGALAFAAARAIAGEAFAAFPAENVTALLQEVMDELRSEPRVLAEVPPAVVDAVTAPLANAARQAGLNGALEVKANPDLTEGSCRLVWSAGAVEERIDQLTLTVEDAIRRWLRAEDGDEAQLDLFKDAFASPTDQGAAPADNNLDLAEDPNG